MLEQDRRPTTAQKMKYIIPRDVLAWLAETVRKAPARDDLKGAPKFYTDDFRSDDAEDRGEFTTGFQFLRGHRDEVWENFRILREDSERYGHSTEIAQWNCDPYDSDIIELVLINDGVLELDDQEYWMERCPTLFQEEMTA